jgi:hypothetical protein
MAILEKWALGEGDRHVIKYGTVSEWNAFLLMISLSLAQVALF